MRAFITSTLVFTMSVSVLLAQDDTAKPKDSPTEKESPLKTLKDRASYGIGQNLAAQIKFNDELDLDFELVIKGFQDNLTDKPSLMTDEQLQNTMLELQQEMRKRALDGQKAKLEKNMKEGEAFLAKNKEREGVKTTESGLQYEVIKKGKGGAKPKATDTVKTHYHGTLIDGTVFDSSVERGEPVSFPLNGVISGWTEALQLMSVGDKYRLFLPSDLAYGDRGAGAKIGPGTTLIFEVELLDIEPSEGK